MRRGASARVGRDDRRGFTLIEMVVALAIVALAFGVALPAFRRVDAGTDLDRATTRVQTLFRMARDSAVRGGLPVTVVVDSATGLVWVDTPQPLALANAHVRDSLTAPPDQDEMDPSARLRADLAPAMGAGADSLLEPGSTLGLPTSVKLVLPRARAVFTFDPSGVALADSVVLRGEDGARTVTVDPWVGDARVRAAR